MFVAVFAAEKQRHYQEFWSSSTDILEDPMISSGLRITSQNFVLLG